MSDQKKGVEIWLDPGDGGERLSSLDAPTALMQRLANRISRRFNRECQAELGISTPVARMIAALQHHRSAGFRQLVESTGMDKAQASRTLAAMLKDGLIALDGPVPDRFTARTTASLTAAGRDLYDRGFVIARRQQMEILEALSPEERRTFYSVLHRLIDMSDRWEAGDEAA